MRYCVKIHFRTLDPGGDKAIYNYFGEKNEIIEEQYEIINGIDSIRHYVWVCCCRYARRFSGYDC